MDVAQFKALADKRIEGANAQRKAWEKRFEETKTKVETLLMTETTKVINREATIKGIGFDSYIKLLPEYATLKKENQNQDMDKDTFFNLIKEKNIGLYCDILGRYTAEERMNNGTDKFDKKLEDAYDIKNSKKSALKQRANEILKLYDDILKSNQMEIQKLEDTITSNKEYRKTLENRRTDTVNKYKIKGNLTKEEAAAKDAEISKIDAEITTLDKKIETDINSLNDIKLAQAQYEFDVRSAKNEFSDSVKDGANVDIGGSDTNQPAPSDNGTKSAGASTSNAIRRTINSNVKEKDIAKKMLLDIRNMDTASRTALINQYGYEDLYQMTKSLGILGRTELKKMLDETIKKDTIKFDRAVIKDGKISNSDIKILEQEIQDFMKNISSKTYTEIREFEVKIEKINIITLSQAANYGKFKQFFNRFTSTGVNFNNLNLALKKFSNMRYDRETAALNATNAMRSKIHVTLLQDQRPRTFVDRNCRNPIYNDRSK